MVFYLCLLRAKSSTGQKCNADKSAKIKDFYQSALCIRAIVSTWLELIELMSEGDFWHHLYVGTYQWVFGCFPRNRRSREHINRYRAGFFAKARVEIKIIICQPFCMFKLYASNSFFTSIHNLCDELPLGKYPINSFTKIVTN